jgi:hypothetical protein
MLRGARRDHQRKQPEDECKRRHHRRTEAQSRALGRRIKQRNPTMPMASTTASSDTVFAE